MSRPPAVSALARSTARSVAYLLASFAAGLVYVVFLVTGVAVGASLLVVVVGVFVLAGTLALSRYVAVFDARAAAWLFDLSAPSMPGPDSEGGLLEATVAEFRHAPDYRAVLYLCARIATGFVGFVLVVTWVAVSVSMLFAPLLYADWTYTVAGYEIGTLPAAMGVAALGLSILLAGGYALARTVPAVARATTRLLR